MPVYYTITYEFEMPEEDEEAALRHVRQNYHEPSNIEVEGEDED